MARRASGGDMKTVWHWKVIAKQSVFCVLTIGLWTYFFASLNLPSVVGLLVAIVGGLTVGIVSGILAIKIFGDCSHFEVRGLAEKAE